MSRRCGSSKPTPTPLNGKAAKSAKYVKNNERKRSLKGQEGIVKENHRLATRDGGGEEDAWKKSEK